VRDEAHAAAVVARALPCGSSGGSEEDGARRAVAAAGGGGSPPGRLGLGDVGYVWVY
jgi:hypothetical protein